jgi:predicted ATP-dependent endonuclease of OLD family
MASHSGVSALLASIRIRGFRSAHDVTLEPGPITALVGEAGTGKSNLLVAIWKLLAPNSPQLEPGDVAGGSHRSFRIEATLGSGGKVRVEGVPAREEEHRSGKPPAAMFFPASERADGLVAAGAVVPRSVEQALERSPSPALALVQTFEAWLEEQTHGLVVMIEEPELFLRPHAQRALYRLLREFAARGNQVIYSTHAATFLNVARLEELALVEHDAAGATHIRRPSPLPEAEAFRALSEFDAERSELLLARAALLVEGRTEKLVFPFLFRALGYDADREGISIVECGGKPNIPVIAQVCNLVGIPYLVVYDRDAEPGRRPIASERAVNQAIARVAGRKRTNELARDFEAVAQLHGHRHKPERALHWFALAEADDVPKQLAEVVTRTVALARQESVSQAAR